MIVLHMLEPFAIGFKNLKEKQEFEETLYKACQTYGRHLPDIRECEYIDIEKKEDEKP